MTSFLNYGKILRQLNDLNESLVNNINFTFPLCVSFWDNKVCSVSDESRKIF